MLNLAVILEESARLYPDRVAFYSGSARLTFQELDAQASQVGRALRASGLERGDRVALCCPNLLHFPTIYHGILKAGGVVVPLNVLLKAREVAYHLRDSGAKMFFCFEGSAELPVGKEGAAGHAQVESCERFILLPAKDAPGSFEGTEFGRFMARASGPHECVDTGADDLAVILYTSGTTGQPKGAELTHSNLLLNAVISRELFHQGPEDVGLITLPLFHSFGQTVQMNTSVLAGAGNVLLPRFDPGAALQQMQDHDVTFFAGVPTMYWSLLHHSPHPSIDLGHIGRCLRLAVSGGAAMPVEVLRAFEERFRVPILEGYGLSETSPVACFNHLDRPRKVGSIGTPVWGVAFGIRDEKGEFLGEDEEGEIVIRGHNVMRGYHGRAAETSEVLQDGWLRTGDIGKRDAEGYYYVVDRKKDMIIRGGFNVYPREIEEVLLEHPGISLAAVIGVPSDEHGEEIKAIVLRVPGSGVTEAEVLEWCRERLAAYKYPRLVEFREELPMTATGKVLKRKLRG